MVNERARMLAKRLNDALRDHETGDHIDYYAEELFQLHAKGESIPWRGFPLAKGYTECRIAGAKVKGIA